MVWKAHSCTSIEQNSKILNIVTCCTRLYIYALVTACLLIHWDRPFCWHHSWQCLLGHWLGWHISGPTSTYAVCTTTHILAAQFSEKVQLPDEMTQEYTNWKQPDFSWQVALCSRAKPRKQRTQKMFVKKKWYLGLPWWLSGKESAHQCRRHGFNPLFRKIPHVVGQLSPCTTTVEPVL